MDATKGNTYLFESRRCEKYTSRRIQQIIAHYGQKAGIDKRVHPHLFRHQCLTELTKAGLTDAQIQKLSGHASRKSLEGYTHIALKPCGTGLSGGDEGAGSMKDKI